jgi:sporulation protein YlmC with PRC-barrel domain
MSRPRAAHGRPLQTRHRRPGLLQLSPAVSVQYNDPQAPGIGAGVSMPKPEKILAQELLELEVLDLTAGETVGSVLDFSITRDGRVALIGLLPVQWYRGGLGITPQSIAGLNHDCICLAHGAVLAPFAPDEQESFSVYFGDHIQGKPVLQEDGALLGELVDFCFNLEDGRILDLIVQDASEKRVRVPVEALKTIGRDYIVIQRGGTGQAVSSSTPEAVVAMSQADAPEATDTAPGTAVAADDILIEAALPEVGPGIEPAEQSAPSFAAEHPVPPELTRAEEKAALFGTALPAELSKFDQKKRDFLRGRKAHREIKTAGGELIAAKGAALDDAKLNSIVEAGLLGEVFIEMTLSKKE